ncbi:MAG: hypothetical protein AABY53_03430 [Bdellovibrionota bacterium]
MTSSILNDVNNELTPLKELIVVFSPISIVEFLLKRLNHVGNSKSVEEWGNWTPWDMLLLLKLVIAFDSKSIKPALEKDIMPMMDLIINLTTPANKVFESEHPNKTSIGFRIMAFQQFWLQPVSNLFYFDIARNQMLFNSQFPQYDFPREFKTVTGIDFQTFQKIVQILMTWIELRTISEDKRNISIKFKGIPEIDVSNFFKLVSTSFEVCQNEFSNSLQTKKFHLQITERSPLKNKPFLVTQNGAALIYTKLFVYFAKFGVYDLMKNHQSNAFSRSFGKVMENYIRTRLIQNKYDFLNENQIEAIVGKENKKTDFVVKFDKFNIVIESKGIELGNSAMVDPNPLVLANELSGKIIEAMNQCLYISNRISDGTLDSSLSKKTHIFIISYKELFLGNGIHAWHEIFENETKVFRKQNNIENVIPSRIHIMDIAEFDLFLIKTKTMSHAQIETFLDNISALNSVPQTSTLTISQSIELSSSDFENEIDLKKEYQNFIEKIRPHLE